MHPKWLVAALASGIVAGPALADTITVITSFPKELTTAYQKAYEKKYPERQGRDPQQGHRGGHRVRARAAGRQPAGNLLGVGAGRVRSAVLGEAAAEDGRADPRHAGQDRQLSDQRSRRPVPRPGARRLRHDVEHALHAATSCRSRRNGPISSSRSTSATSRSRRRRARARRTSPSRPSCRARAGTKAGTRSCRSPATAPRSPSAASACPTACRTASSASAW